MLQAAILNKNDQKSPQISCTSYFSGNFHLVVPHLINFSDVSHILKTNTFHLSPWEHLYLHSRYMSGPIEVRYLSVDFGQKVCENQTEMGRKKLVLCQYLVSKKS